MKVLGLWDGHDAGAALLEDGVITRAVSEERLSRVKRQGGFPVRALRWILADRGLGASEVDVVAVAGLRGRFPARCFDRHYAAVDPGTVNPLSPVSVAFASYQNRLARIPGLRAVESAASKVALARRLRSLGLPGVDLVLVDHHRAHAESAAAYLEPGDGQVATLDGYGDGVSTALWELSRAGLRRRWALGPGSSFALLYGALARDLGFREGEEGKVTALATRPLEAAALEQVRPLVARLRACVHGRGEGFTLHRKAARRALRDAGGAGLSPELRARALQEVMEEALLALLSRELPGPQAAVAGGLFANVSLSGKQARSAWESRDPRARFAVCAAMTDQGLCVGAALAAARDLGAPASTDPFPDLRIGPGPGPVPSTARSAEVAELAERLAQGRVLAVARGPLEFGPRALGGRSLLFDPRNPELAARVGAKVGRPQVMPFEPILRAERWSALFDLPRAPIWRASREMTLALPARPEFQQLAPAAVHLDGTARPQVLDPGDDPVLIALLEAFEARTGCPALINTSLNRHREPIVASAARASELAVECGFDLLLDGPVWVPGA